ncbi:MAG: hypothetical protein LE180_02720 [Endomicrobium sp.]|uniref:hypothetical protein n=1 Tax=Candidatus Endomicrobiellum pyrsonymphae TaxID=1408203 RepID=UPI00357B03F3|nr:hypothetical protein [Endomicrobium sp.]
MKRVLFSVLIFSFFATNAFANCITDILFNRDCSVFFGHATADMDVNGSIVDTNEECHGIKPGDKNAVMAGGETFYDIGKNFKVCTKMFLVCSGSHKIDQTSPLGRKIGGNFHSGLIPAMAGVSYNRNISEKFSLNGKLFLGYGATFFGSHAYVIENGKKNYYKHTSKIGCCFVSDLSVGAEYVLTKRYKLGLDVGYRFTPKTTISDDIKLDFSGLTAALSCAF